MTWDLGRLEIERLIVHEIPVRTTHDGSDAPILSEIESPLTPQVKTFFRERIANSLANAAYEVEFDPKSTSDVPRLIKADLGTRGDIVPMSQAMANSLHQSQKGYNPAGLLTVLQGTLEGRLAVAILKLEREEGARFQIETVGTKKTLSISHLRDLMLTGKTKVFKVGLFAHASGAKRARVHGLVSDKQRGYGTAVAQFFLRQFLGCRLRERPELTTQRFFEATEQFINDKIDDPETKARYTVALLAELSSPSTSVSLQDFATQQLDVKHRQSFVEHAAEHNLAAPAFEKDTTLIASHLRRIQLSFQSGIAVLASREQIGEQVLVEDLDDGRTKVEIKDILKNVRGRN